MLHSISWAQYATLIITCAAAWYAYVGLRFYQPEIQKLLRIKPKQMLLRHRSLTHDGCHGQYPARC